MEFLKRMKLMIWFVFNRHKVHEYIDFSNTKFTIYNKFYWDEDIGWNVVVINSSGEILTHESFEYKDLPEVKQRYSEQMKPVYVDYYVGGFDIVTIMPGDEYPVGYKDAAEVFKKNQEIVK